MKSIVLILSFIVTLSTWANDPIVAEVNGTTIRQSTLLKYHEQNLKFVQSNKDTSIEASLNQLIDRAIGIKAAKSAGIQKDPEVVKKMNDILYHAYISKQLTSKLQSITVTEKDVREYFNKYPEYKTSQILLRLRAIPSPEEVGQTLELANNIYKDAKQNPDNFSELAKKYGQTSTSLTGGDMGFQPRSRLSKEYFDTINGRNIGFISKPIRTQYGIHIIKVTGKKEYSEIDQNLYKSIIHNQKRDEIMNNYFEAQRKAAKIKINKENLKL